VLLVGAGDETFALPLRSVQETLRVTPKQIHAIENREVLCLPDRNIPLLRLSKLLNHSVTPASEDSRKAVVVAVGDTRAALLVDKLIGQESTVIKALGNLLKDSPTIAGATIGGDGRVRLLLDPAALLDAAIAMEGVPA
jgi:two-component system chemotaxis sensor kinase CheA